MTLGWTNPITPPTITVLLRHGDTRLSPEHRFSGLSDLPLRYMTVTHASGGGPDRAAVALRLAPNRFAAAAAQPDAVIHAATGPALSELLVGWTKIAPVRTLSGVGGVMDRPVVAD